MATRRCLLKQKNVITIIIIIIIIIIITGPPNGPVVFCTLSSVGVVCRRL